MAVTDTPVAEKVTFSEALNSLNGVEYDAASRMARKPLTSLLNEDVVKGMYVLVTVLEQRGSKTLMLADVQKKYTVGQINDYFAPEPDADDEDSEVGNA